MGERGLPHDWDATGDGADAAGDRADASGCQKYGPSCGADAAVSSTMLGGGAGSGSSTKYHIHCHTPSTLMYSPGGSSMALKHGERF